MRHRFFGDLFPAPGLTFWFIFFCPQVSLPSVSLPWLCIFLPIFSSFHYIFFFFLPGQSFQACHLNFLPSAPSLISVCSLDFSAAHTCFVLPPSPSPRASFFFCSLPLPPCYLLPKLFLRPFLLQF